MFIAIITSIAFLSVSLESKMTPEELKETGVLRLSSKERSSLQNWIASNYSKKTSKKKEKKPVLEENLKNGHYIRLSDKTLWEINPSDTPITQGWISAVEIDVTHSGDIDYPYTLTNTLTESSVGAKSAKSISSKKKIYN